MAEALNGAGYAYTERADDKAPPSIVVPPAIHLCLRRGRAQMKRDASKRRLCVRFERGDTFTYLGRNGQLFERDTVTGPGRSGKPPHRSRNQYNYIRPVVEDKVSSATQRVPSFEVDPATTDPEDAAGAKLSERVAVYGYDKWMYRAATIDVVKTAVGLGGSAYAMAYFDPNVGPYAPNGEGGWAGLGEVRIKTFNGNEVYWEPGVKFEISRWWATEQAEPVATIREMPGYAGGALVPDASVSDIPNDRAAESDLAMVTRYYERPCPRWPRGRLLTIANGRVVLDARLVDPTTDYPWEDYPKKDPDGQVLDEPVLRRLVYTHDPDDDDDLGLTWQLIDFQRSVQDCDNKMVEFKNRGLNLQMKAPAGSLIDTPDDVPGAIKKYKPGPNGEQPEWERAPDGSILNALIQIKREFLQDMYSVAAYQDIQADPNVAARTVGAVMENTRARWQSFLGDLAEFHSRLMRDCLLLVARYYTEPRLLEIRGRMGWEPIRDFRGSHLNGQANVRVFPGSLEYLTKAQVTARVQYYASMGWVSGQQAMQAIENGQVEKVTEDYNLAVAKINRIIQRIRDGTLMQMPTRTEKVPAINPMTGQAAIGPDGQQLTVDQDVPAWMPSEFDNVPIWQENLARWMQTEDFENSPPEAQEAGRLMWAQLRDLAAQKAQEAARQQQAMAQSLGMGNAAAPQGPPSPPSQPNVAAETAAPAQAPTDQGAPSA